MNHPLSLLDWQFYQSRYLAEDDRVATVLLATRDPGRPVVFLGYALLLVGLCVVLATRVAQFRKKVTSGVQTQLPERARYALGLGLAVALVVPAVFKTGTIPQSHDATIEALRRLPVQHDGRVMPLDTLARETLRRATNHTAGQASDPVTTFVARAFDESTPLSAALRASLRCIPGTNGSQTWTAPDLAQQSELTTLATGKRVDGWPHPSSIEREITYNRWQPMRLAWVALAVAFVQAALAWLLASRILDKFAVAGLIAGFCALCWGIATRWRIAGHIPATNMYESLMFLAFGVVLVALVLIPWMRNRLVLLNACGLSALTLALADLLPIDPFIHPMPPVLSGTPWLAIHVPIIMLSYSLLALSVLVAHVQIGITIWAPARHRAIKSASATLYWYIHAGCLLLTAGIVTGSVWAASSWGRYWGWDPKEVWSLVALLAYVALLHARHERLLQPFALAAISIVAFQAILMTYLGVNFVLGTGLHSYAMGDSPVARWMLLGAGLEVAFLFYAVAARKRHRQPVPQLG
jgi:cytochrome c-type biogenesis protein CcsB